MLKLLPAASGSTGNCMLADIDGYIILIDLGITAKALAYSMHKNGYDWSDIDAVLITHTHIDHIKGLEVCLKRISAPVFMSGTSRDRLMLDRAVSLPYFMRSELIPGLWATAIPTSHDCPGSIGFLIETENTRLGYLTDLGILPESTMEILYGCHCIVIESNHDEEMLRYGSHPIYLKRRILSEAGHLSNDACAAAAIRFAEYGTRHFLLAHLSRENNSPQRALDCTRKALAGRDVQIEVLPDFGERLIQIYT